MPDVVFRVLLPLVWTWLLGLVAANRWRIQRRLRRDPVVMRPWRKVDTAAGYLEAAFAIGAFVLTADVLLNAVAPAAVARALAIPALRASTWAGCLGLALATLGILLITVAVAQMGLSWRIGIDDQGPGPLVSSGIFARVRHPIYAGLILATTGLAVVTADLFSVAVAAAALVGLPVQARLEEEFLAARYPQEYASYLKRSGRFWPRRSRP